MTKERLDILVQERFQLTRSKAQGLIQTNCVRNGAGEILNKAGMRLDPDVELVLEEGPRFVSRGGEKLEHALKHFPVSVQDRVVLDTGASTGGFTDCLLQYGASHVYAVDVGYGQLAWTLRQDPRVTVLERCNIRNLQQDQLPLSPTFFTVDCSFISLKIVLPCLVNLLSGTPEGIVLIKPQFEAGRHQVGKGGVVRDEKVHREVVEGITDFAKDLGFREVDTTPSPLLGPAGNREFLAWLRGFQADAARE
ncbi:MAG: TlyA family RNA methyltransferase [Candidatus Hydrogenedens sp.]|jgi:23S rRNA (cytidine1920-2'-O)/16S rRNA (cytidine1409-2'-O)-methyltransferase|nr:TlyA family RNA methyltransferase [Candidatus Hydrogenedens sp.]